MRLPRSLRVSRMQERVTTHAENPQFIGISALCKKLRARARCNKKFSEFVLLDAALLTRRQCGARDLHTKLSGVTVIFFPL
jgi:hypothetical protein